MTALAGRFRVPKAAVSCDRPRYTPLCHLLARICAWRDSRGVLPGGGGEFAEQVRDRAGCLQRQKVAGVLDDGHTRAGDDRQQVGLERLGRLDLVVLSGQDQDRTSCERLQSRRSRTWGFKSLSECSD